MRSEMHVMRSKNHITRRIRCGVTGSKHRATCKRWSCKTCREEEPCAGELGRGVIGLVEEGKIAIGKEKEEEEVVDGDVPKID